MQKTVGKFYEVEPRWVLNSGHVWRLSHGHQAAIHKQTK